MNNKNYKHKHEIYSLDLIDGINVKFCPNTDNKIAADRLGNIYMVKQGRLMKKYAAPNCHGYVLLGGIWYNGKYRSKYAHTLVIEAFVGIQNGMVVDHLNGNKSDNRLENLEYVTPKENCKRYSEYCKNNDIKRVRGKLAKNYQIIEYDSDWNEVRRFDSMKEAGQTIAAEEGTPDKWNSIATQISYVISNKYGCKTVHGRNFKLADENLMTYIRKKTEKSLTPEETDIVERMKQAVKEMQQEREKDNIEPYKPAKTKNTVVIHKYYPKQKISVDFTVEADNTNRVALSDL